jgi:hypothetical protein
MHQIFKGLIAAVAIIAAAPAMACGYSPCAQPVYVAPVAAYAGCNPCGGWVRERLPDPEQQYYWVNQGPTYTGPGNWAPVPNYSEGGSYRVSPNYGYRAYRPRAYGYGYHRPYRAAYRYGYAPRQYGMHAAPYHYGHRVLRRYY